MPEIPIILGFGASSMQGTGDPDGGFFARVARQRKDLTFVNLGIGGNTSRDMLMRVDQVEQYRPFKAIILLGCNDLPREPDGNPMKRISLEEYAQHLDALLPKLEGVQSLFISSFPPDPVRSGVAASTMDAYMAEAIRLAKRHGFAIWDLYAELRGAPQLATYWSPDGVHFNAAGHAMIAEQLIEHL